MGELIGIAVALYLLRYLLRLPGRTSRRDRITFRFRVPLRERYPRAWWSLVAFGLLVVAPVFGLGSACGWWGP
ncbi:hypothetical protein [Actinomadura sp. 9N407]|uniref:hypothetical protein n=1 Tax=Actinomadura sp. 9N407 TaxID=3375154 RepID=UPI0037A9233A